MPNRTKFTLIVALLLSSSVVWALGPTNVTDVLYLADGVTRYNGVLHITWGTAFTSADGHVNYPGNVYVTVTNGLFNAPLEPNDTAIPTGTSYTVEYNLTAGIKATEYWVVPTASFTSLANVRTIAPPVPNFMISLSWLSAGGAVAGNCMIFTTSWGPGICGGGGGGGSFTSISTGTNNTAAMVVTTGASLAFSAGGSVDASAIQHQTVAGLSGPIKFTLGVPSVLVASDIINLWSGSCSSLTFLRGDGACAAGGGGGAGIVSMTTGSGGATGNCTAPGSTNLTLYTDVTSQDLWGCVATNVWKKLLSTTGVGQYTVTGAVGAAPARPSPGNVKCYFDSTSLTQVCLDAVTGTFTGVQGLALQAHKFVTNISTLGIQALAQPADADISFTDITTGNVSIAGHGYAPKGDGNTTHYLDALGNYTTPAGGGGGGGGTSFSPVAGMFETSHVIGVGNATINFASVGPTLCGTATTFTFYGARQGDKVAIDEPPLGQGVHVFARVSGYDTVSVELCNFTRADYDAPSLSYGVALIRSN